MNRSREEGGIWDSKSSSSRLKVPSESTEEREASSYSSGCKRREDIGDFFFQPMFGIEIGLVKNVRVK